MTEVVDPVVTGAAVVELADPLDVVGITEIGEVELEPELLVGRTVEVKPVVTGAAVVELAGPLEVVGSTEVDAVEL